MKRLKFEFNNFHKTDFSLIGSLFLLISLFALGRILGLLSSRICFYYTGQYITAYLSQHNLTKTLNILTYVNTQFLPLLIVGIVMCNKHMVLKWISKLDKNLFYRTYQTAHWSFVYPFKHWSKIIGKDIKNNYLLIIMLTILVTIIHLIVNMFFLLVATPNIATPGAVKTAQLLHQSWVMYPLVLIFGAIFEECIFRIALPNLFYGCLNHFKKNKWTFFKYWCSVIISALLFSSFHEGANSSWTVMASYVIFALLLQMIYKKSHSLVLTASVHGLSDFLIVIPYIF